MKKLFGIVLIMISILFVGCGQTSTDSGNDTLNNGMANGTNSNEIMNGTMVNGDMMNGDPMALAGSGGDAGGDPMALANNNSFLGGDNTTSDNTGLHTRFQEVGKVFANINGQIFNYISALDNQNQIMISSYQFNPDMAQYIVQIVAYDIREDRLNPNAGYLMIQFAMPDIKIQNGAFPLLYPKSENGFVHITRSESFNDAFHMTGYIQDANITTENNQTIVMNANFDVTRVLKVTPPPQQQQQQ